MPTTALVPAASAPDPDATQRAERFLARVAALTPAEWGRLDAIGARVTAPDVWGALTRTRLVTRSLEEAGTPAPLTVAAGLGLLAAGITELVLDAPLRAFGVPRRPPKWARRPDERRLTTASLAARAVAAWLERLHDLAAAQPGGAGTSLAVLGPALVAVAVPTRVPTPEALYAPVEPVIPRGSLG